MLQRIQTIYLLVVVLLMGGAPFLLPLWSNIKGEKVFAFQEIPALVMFFVSALLALVTIFLFKNRKNQFILNRLNIILTLFLLGFFVYHSLNLSGEIMISEKGIGMLLPLFSIVLLVLANKAIKKDEDLVKSMDRLR